MASEEDQFIAQVGDDVDREVAKFYLDAHGSLQVGEYIITFVQAYALFSLLCEPS